MSEIEDMLNQLQLQSQQMQTIAIQKQTLLIQSKEIERALLEIEKAKAEEIYKSVGPILVKTTKEDIKKDLMENKEDIELKVKSLDRQEKKIKEKINEFQERFQALSQKGQGG